MDDLQKQEHFIDNELIKLQKQVYYCVNNYDYHHRNNELDIIQDNFDALKDAAVASKSFIRRIRQFRASLAEAQRKCDQFDQVLLNMGLLKKVESKENANDGEDNDEDSDEKENKNKQT